jgi:hypothetical protein
MDRKSNGTFANGNSGGPGRPRRTVEADYLAALSDMVGIDDWHAIVMRAVLQAKAGDGKARDWLSRHLLGAEPPKLLDLAADEELGRDAVAERARDVRRHNRLDKLYDQMAGTDAKD